MKKKKFISTIISAAISTLLALAAPPSAALTPGFPAPGFRDQTGGHDDVLVVAPLRDGRVVVGGRFLNYGNRSARGIALLRANGQPDPAFDAGSGFDGTPEVIAIQPDGKILVGGFFDHYAGFSTPGLARLLPSGRMDPDFTNVLQSGNAIQSIALQADGKILIGGEFLSITGQTRTHIARLHPDGTLDPGFNADQDPASPAFADGAWFTSIRSIVVLPDQSILVAGDFATAQGKPRDQLARLLPDGTLDDTVFLPAAFGASAEVQSVAVQTDGKILVLGSFTSYGGAPVNSPLIRLNQDGSRDDSFIAPAAPFEVPDPDDSGQLIELRHVAVLPRPDGRIVTVSQSRGGRNPIVIRQFLPSGALDSRFQVDPFSIDNTIYSAALGRDGRLVLGGEQAVTQNHSSRHVSRLLTNGNVDRSFSAGMGFDDSDLRAVHIQPHDQHILVGGTFRFVDGRRSPSLARLRPDGRVDPRFQSPFAKSADIRAIQTDPQRRVYVGGFFNLHSSSASQGLVRLLPNGSVDTTFVPELLGESAGPFPLGAATAILVQPDGKILVAGGFHDGDSSTEVRHLVRLNADGSADPDFTIYKQPQSALFEARCVALLPDGGILLGGGFGLVRMGPNGENPQPFGPALEPDPGTSTITVNAILVGPGNRIYVAGLFRYPDFFASLICIDEQGNLVNSPDFQPGGGFNESGEVLDLAALPDGRLVAAGTFLSYQFRASRGITVFHPNGAIDSFFDTGADIHSRGFQRGIPRQVAVDSAGDIIVAGSFERFRNQSRPHLVKILSRYLLPGRLALGGTEWANTDLNDNRGGGINLTLTRSGAFSARRRSLSGNLSFRGRFDPAMHSMQAVSGDRVLMARLYQEDCGALGAYGELRRASDNPGTGADILAYASSFSNRTRLATQFEGTYNLYLENATSQTDPDLPAGDGFMVARYLRNGSARITGRNNDGSPFTFAGFIGVRGDVLFHSQFLRNRAAIHGYLQFAANNLPPTLAGDFVAHRLPNPAARDYPLGYSHLVESQGTLYRPPAGIPLGLPNTPSNGILLMSGPPLASDLESVLSINHRGVVVPVTGGINSLRLRINNRTGLVTGTYLAPGQTRPRRAIRALIVPNFDQAFGHAEAPNGDGQPRHPRVILVRNPGI
jgi:uncharacterized delta-60 repeat protein